MGRIFSATFAGVAVTAQQDLFSILAPATEAIHIHGLILSQTTEIGDAMEEQLSIQVTSGATSAGSVGTSPTAIPDFLGSTAFGGTVRANDTTRASAGTIVTHHSDTWNVRTQFLWMPPPELRWRIAPSARLVVGLLTTPADSITMNGTIYFESV